ncbi:MAG TPA: glycosyl transferase, partial [Catenuloplanes sp.]
MTTVAFVLASWRPDVPAGMERAVAGHVAAITAAGHRAVIITADHGAPTTYRNADVVTLTALPVSFPCDDDTLRDTITGAADAIRSELISVFVRERVDAAIYLDALWGLGRIMPQHPRTRNVLAVHVVGHDNDLNTALGHQPAAIIAPSTTV